MSTGHANGQSLLESKHRHHVRAHVEFSGANGANPADATIVDRSGILRAATPRVERISEGVYRLHLRNDWKNMSATVGILSSNVLQNARIRTRTMNAGFVSLYVLGTLEDGAGVTAVDDLDGVPFLVDFDLSNSDDF